MKINFVYLVLFINLLCIVISLVEGAAAPKPVVNEKVAVRFAAGANPQKIADTLGFHNLGTIGNLKDYYLFQLRDEFAKTKVMIEERIQQLGRHPAVTWVEKQVIKERFKKPL